MAPEANRQKGPLQMKVQIRDPDRFLTPELTAKVEFLKPGQFDKRNVAQCALFPQIQWQVQ